MSGQERIMRGDENPPAELGLREQPGGERGLAVGVDAARRLVEHEQIGLRDRDGGDAEALALATREVAGMTAAANARPNSSSDAAARTSSPPTPSATSSITVSRTR